MESINKNKSPINFFDIGSRWGVETPWNFFSPEEIRIFLFEPDPSELILLKAKYPYYTLIETALSNYIGTTNLYLTAEPGKSSLRLPNRAFLDIIDNQDEYKIVKTIEIPVSTFDNILFEGGYNADAVKIDAQGVAYEILQGMSNALNSVVFIQVEVEFHEVYKGQFLFHDVDILLKDYGFELLDIRKHWFKNGVKGKGQIIFADAFYIKNQSCLSRLPEEKKDKLINILKIHEYNGKASELKNNKRDVKREYFKDFIFKNKIFKFYFKINFIFIYLLSRMQLNYTSSSWGNDNNSIDFTNRKY